MKKNEGQEPKAEQINVAANDESPINKGLNINEEDAVHPHQKKDVAESAKNDEVTVKQDPVPSPAEKEEPATEAVTEPTEKEAEPEQDPTPEPAKKEESATEVVAEQAAKEAEPEQDPTPEPAEKEESATEAVAEQAAKEAEPEQDPTPEPAEKEESATEAVAETTEKMAELESQPGKEGETVEVKPATEKEAITISELSSSIDDDTDALSALYNDMDRGKLVEIIEALVEDDDVNLIRKHIGFIKVAYRKLLRDENMASYEMRLSKDKDENEEAAATDDLTERFDKAFNIYKEKKVSWDKALEKEMQDNLKLKEEILESLRELIDSEEELKKTYDQFNDLQERWRAVGPVPRGSKSTLWNNYHFLVEKFFDKVNINKELKDLDLKKNLEAKTELCEKAEELFLESSITKSFQQLQKLHEAWKEVGPVPKDKKDEVWERFRSATEKLNKRRQDHYDILREEQNKNFAAKLVLCEKAEEILTFNPETPKQWQEKTNKINELFKVWKTIGFAPKKVNNEVWNRFRNALDTFFANKKEFFRKYKDQQRDNYNQKLNLCLQAEALKDSEDWRNTTEALINMQNEWKKIGAVPAKFSDKIWKRFRQACDHFFNRKSKHFSNIGDQQNNNLKEKLDLIEQVKKFEYSDDNKENLNVLKDFQRKWMDIGHVPIKHKEKLQSDFRKAIDHQFDILNISKKAKNTLSFRTKIENLKNVQNADAIIQKERNFITNKIKNLESDIKVLENNIGFFASSKKADILKAEFEEKIDKARNEIGLLKEKMKILRES